MLLDNQQFLFISLFEGLTVWGMECEGKDEEGTNSGKGKVYWKAKHNK